MSKTFDARRLDVEAFARLRGRLAAREPVQKYERLAAEIRSVASDLTVDWQANGSQRQAVDASVRPALHLQASAHMPLTCQRCMGDVDTLVAVDRHFVFVPDEDTASALDDESEDDVLAVAPDFNLHALIEDELLMALPLVPRHDICPSEVRLSAQTADFDAGQGEKVNSFAALAALKNQATDGTAGK